MRKRIFGFDLGITSIGWAVVDFDKEYYNEETGEVVEGKIAGSGVRCFPIAENPKDGTSLAAPRRAKKSARKRCRRKACRMQSIKNLFAAQGIVASVDELNKLYAEQTGGDVWNLRIKGVYEKLSKEELVRVLTHLAKHRGFKSYRKAVEESDKEGGKVLQAIKANKDAIENGKTLAQVIVERAGANGKKRNCTKEDAKGKKVAVYNNSIPHDEIERELDLIFNAQNQYGVFTEKLYEDFKRIAFLYHLGGGVGHMVGFCTFEKNEKRAPKEAPSSELFVALTKINNMSVNDNGVIRTSTEDERTKIIELLKNTKTVKYTTLASKVFPKGTIFRDINYNQTVKRTKEGKIQEINPLDVVFYEMKGWHKLKSKFTAEEWNDLSSDTMMLDKVVNIIACEKNDEAISNGLRENGIKEEYIGKFVQCTFDKFINLSFKALYNIIPFMETGMLYNSACEKAGYDFRAGGDTLVDKKGVLLAPIAEDKQTTVPVVNRTVAQFRKVYNAMVRKYGLPDQINIETGRDLKKSHDERQKIKNKNDENRKEREIAAAELEACHIKGNSTNILKYRLYQEQDGKCIYSGNVIDINRLDEVGYLDIDHIIPYSRSLDNSYNNKVLCLSSENRMKSNMTPFEYLKDSGRWDDFEVRVKLLHNKVKENHLLDKTFVDRELEFRERNANDNSYISKYVKQYCEDGIDFSSSPWKDIKTRVQMRTGTLTDYLRHHWGLKKDRDENDLHHAQDAIVIACATQEMVGYLSYVSKIFEDKYKIQERKGETWYKTLKKRFEEPWAGFREDVWASLDKIFVSRPPRKSATGSAHKDSIYSEKDKKGSVSVRGGMAEKDNMFRLDVFEKEGHFYIVPIYTIDIVSQDRFEDAPQPYLTADDGKHVVIDNSYRFKFSLYKDDYVSLNTNEESVSGYLNQYNAQSGQLYIGSMDNSSIFKIKTSTFTVKDKILLINGKIGIVEGFDELSQKMKVYYDGKFVDIDAEIKKDKKGEGTKNIKPLQRYIKLSNEKKVSISVVKILKKYQIDPLGQLVEIQKETRAPIHAVKSHKQRLAERKAKKSQRK